MQTIRFLDVDFHIAPHPRWRELILAPAAEELRILVTPNVDHVVHLAQEAPVREAYAAADWHLCDSRILQKLAQRRGLDLAPYPGADLVRDLLADPRARGLRIAVFGPGFRDYERLAALYPQLDLVYLRAPMLTRGSAEWNEALAAVEAARFDIVLLCISFPKQEFFALDLKRRGVARGLAICAGASLDFLTGRQHRAPEWMRRLSLEWLYRALSQPRRLGKRYLVDAPRLWRLYRRGSA